jgi:cardiolipin synthase
VMHEGNPSPRALHGNDEANLNVLDEEFATGQANVFEQDKAHSRRITLEDWRARPWRERLQERPAGLFRAQL